MIYIKKSRSKSGILTIFINKKAYAATEPLISLIKYSATH